MTTTVYLLRHAESQPSPDVPLVDWPLNQFGRQQALDLVPQLLQLDIKAIYSSPFPRARDTVAPFAIASGFPTRIDEDLRERKLTDNATPDFRETVRKTWSDFDYSPPGGESSAACQRRIVAAVESIANLNDGSTVLIVSHGNAISLYLNNAEPTFGFDGWAAMRTPDLFRVEVSGDSHVWRANETILV